jgi:hypothetical protein
MGKCLQAAYSDYQDLVDNEFINLKHFSYPLSYPEFVRLFEKYDWGDIIEAMEELDYSIYVSDFENINQALVYTIQECKIDPVISIWHNSYFIECYL